MLQNLKSDLDEVCQRIRDIEAREIYLYQGINYELVLFKELKPEHIHRCIVISKLDKDSMFPTVLRFRSEADFLSYQYKTANYLFAINPEETITRFRKDAERLENEHSEMLSEIPDYLELLNSGFKEFVDREVSEAEGKFYNAQEREMEVQSRIYTVEIEREAYKDDLAEPHEKDSRAEKLRYEAERTRIMKTYKGKYTFIWIFVRLGNN